MNWKGIIKNIAPTLASALGGPMAGVATKFIAEKLLGKSSATDEELQMAIFNASPAELARLREIDNEFAVEMAKLGVDVFRIEVDDRKSARDMAKVNMWPQIGLSILFIAGYFTLLSVILSGDIVIPENLRDTSSILLGVLTTSIPMIMQFWFGSSSGSKEKNLKLGAK